MAIVRSNRCQIATPEMKVSLGSSGDESGLSAAIVRPFRDRENALR